jgi:hypothetical protein
MGKDEKSYTEVCFCLCRRCGGSALPNQGCARDPYYKDPKEALVLQRNLTLQQKHGAAKQTVGQ